MLLYSKNIILCTIVPPKLLVAPHIILAKTRIVVVRTSLAADPVRDQCKSFPYGWMKSLLGFFLAIIVPNPR